MRLILTLCLLSFALILNAADGPIVSLFGRVQLRGSVHLRPSEVSSLIVDMIACWPLDELGGTTREDDFGIFDLTDVNTVSQITGPVGLGNAAGFSDASAQHLTRADAAALRMGDFSTTFVAWVNLTDNSAFHTVLGKDNSGDRGYVLYHDHTDNKFEFTVFDTMGGSANAISSSAVLEDTGWHFIVCGYDKPNNRLFVSIDNGAEATAAMAAPPRAGTAVFVVGGRAYPVFEDYWQGGIAGVALWNRLLTAGEITTLYAGGNGSRACEEGGN